MSRSHFLAALAWPKSSQKRTIIAPPTFTGRLLNALTYSITASALDTKESSSSAKPGSTVNKKEDADELWEKVYQNKKQPEKAIAYLNRITTLDSNNTAAINRLGIVYAERGDFEASLEYFRQLIRLEKSAAAYHNLGLTYYATGNYQNAALALRKALALEENVASRHIAYAKVQERLGNDKVLLRSLEKAVEIERSVDTLFLLLKAYDEYGLEAEAAVAEKELLDMITPFRNLRHALSKSRNITALYVD